VPTTILAVDDSVTMRKALEITFAGTEFSVVTCDNGPTALEKVKTERPALVIVDVSLPPADGYELCTTIKLAAPQIPVLMLSSKQSPFDAGKGAQADAHVDKPFDTQALADKVREMVAGGAAVAKAPAAATQPAAHAAPAKPPVVAPAAQPEARAAAPAPAPAAAKPKPMMGPGPAAMPAARPMGAQPGAAGGGPGRMGGFPPPAGGGTQPITTPSFKDTIPMAGKSVQEAASQARANMLGQRPAGAAEPKPFMAGKPAATPGAPAPAAGGGPAAAWARAPLGGAAPKPAAPAAKPAPEPAAAAMMPDGPEAQTPKSRPASATLPGVAAQAAAMHPAIKQKPAAETPSPSPAGPPLRRTTVSSWPAPPPKDEPSAEVVVPAAASPKAAVAQATAGLEGKLADLGLSAEQVQGVLALSREVIERVVWEVVPTLAETMIKEEIARLTQE